MKKVEKEEAFLAAPDELFAESKEGEVQLKITRLTAKFAPSASWRAVTVLSGVFSVFGLGSLRHRLDAWREKQDEAPGTQLVQWLKENVDLVVRTQAEFSQPQVSGQGDGEAVKVEEVVEPSSADRWEYGSNEQHIAPVARQPISGNPCGFHRD